MQGLRDKMTAASEAWRFEEAAVFRDRIASLNDVMQQQAVETTGGDTDADIIAVAITAGVACVNIAMVRGGRHLGDHAVFPDVVRGTGEALAASDVFDAFISQHYLTSKVPDVVVSQAASDREATAETLSDLAGRRIAFVSEPQSLRRKWLEMAEQGARIALERHLT